MKFKVGDRVKDERYGDGTVIEEYTGSLKNIILVQFDNKHKKLHDGNGVSKKIYEDNICWFYDKANQKKLEIIRAKQFTKSDLKDGDIVTYRNGNKRTIKGNRIVDTDGMIMSTLENYTDNLIHRKVEENDITKVERPIKYETVFERKEEILDKAEKRYLKEVIRPFRGKVKFISKESNRDGTEYIEIDLEDSSGLLPDFEEYTMYKNMKVNKEYTLEELGL